MSQEGAIINKVAASGLLVLEMDSLLPSEEIQALDLAPHLWEGLVLKEKDFRDYIKLNDWTCYENQLVAVFCSVDAIIPHWAYMLVSSKLAHIAKAIHFGNPQSFIAKLVAANIEKIEIDTYRDARVIVKGCGKFDVGFAAYGMLAAKLTPIVKSLMFGEPCSTVPIFKR